MFITFRRTLSLVALVFGLMLPSQLIGAPTVTPERDSANKINLAGRQRMLTQMIAKATCFQAVGVHEGLHSAMMIASRSVYTATLDGLENGNAVDGMLPETDATVLEEIAKTRIMWAQFEPLLGATDPQALEEIMNSSVQLLGQSNAVVKALVASRGTLGELSAAMAHTIDVAGRQRMLSQRMSKAFCAIVGGFTVEAATSELETAVKEFETALSLLREGGTQVLPPPNTAVATKLAEVQTIWDEMAPILKYALGGNEVADISIEYIAATNPLLLKAMNEAIGLY